MADNSKEEAKPATPQEKIRQQCTGCTTFTDSILYGIFLCHGCIKLYLSEWKKIINSHFDVFAADDINASINKILLELSNRNHCFRRIGLADYSNYCDTVLKCRWCKFRKLLRFTTHIPVPRFDRSRQTRLNQFYAQKELIFAQIRSACVSNRCAADVVGSVASSSQQAIPGAGVVTSYERLESRSSPLAGDLSGPRKHDPLYYQLAGSVTEITEPELLCVTSAAALDTNTFSTSPAEIAIRPDAHEVVIEGMPEEEEMDDDDDDDVIMVEADNTHIRHHSGQLCLRYNHMQPEQTTVIGNNLHKIFEDLHLDNLFPHSYLNDLFVPQRMVSIKQGLFECLPVTLPVDFTSKTLNDLCDWPTELIESENKNYYSSRRDAKFGSATSSYNGSKPDSPPRILVPPVAIECKPEYARQRSDYNEPKHGRSFLADRLTRLRGQESSTIWRLQFTLKDLLITKIMQLIPDCQKFYRFLDIQTGDSSTTGDASFNLGAMIATMIAANRHEFAPETIWAFTKSAHEMRQKMHILQVMCNYDSLQRVFFLYSSKIYFSVESLKTHYYSTMGIDETNEFITKMMALSERLVELPKSLIILINMTMAMKEMPFFIRTVIAILVKKDPCLVEASGQLGAQLNGMLQLAMNSMERLVAHYGKLNLIKELEEFLEFAARSQLFILSNKSQMTYLR